MMATHGNSVVDWEHPSGSISRSMGSYGSISRSTDKPEVDADADADTARAEQQEPLLGPAPAQQEESATMSLADKLYAYDLTLSTLTFQRFGRSPTPRLCWEIFSHSGDGFLWLLTIPPVMGVLWVFGLIGPFEPSTKMFLSALSVCMIVDIIAIMLLKLVFRRQRPPHHTADMRFVGPDQHSFPSGHSTRVWCIVALLMDLTATHPWILRDFFYGMEPGVLVALSIVWAMLINFSRIALGRHYPSDVLAGTLIGFFVFYPISAFFIHHYGMLESHMPPPPIY